MKLYRYHRNPNNEISCKIYLEEYQVIRETEKGYWIKEYFSKDTFVLKGANGKRFAYSSPEIALDSFIRRTKSCIGHLERQLYNSKGYLRAALTKKYIELTKEKCIRLLQKKETKVKN